MRRKKPWIFVSAFTMVELMVAMSITGILFLSAVPGYRNSLIAARYVVLKENTQNLSKEYVIYQMAHGEPPEKPWFGEECDSPWYSPQESCYLMENAFLPSFLHFIPTEYVLDPFSKDQSLDTLYYVPQNQIKAMLDASSWQKSDSFSPRDRFIVSRGPDLEIEKISSPTCWDRVLYDASNGITSRGDILLSFPFQK